MSTADQLAKKHTAETTEINRLPVAERISAARDRYAAAVELYASSSLSIKEIAEQTGLTPFALSHHLSRHHRPLLYNRYGLEVPPDDSPVRIKSPRGQSRATHLKYKDAIEACGDIAYAEFNISQIARLFSLNPTGLSAQLRVHYPDIIPAREALRRRLGIADRLHRGALPSSKAAYEKAVSVYKDTDLTIREVADRFGISFSGFGQYMRHYHHDAIDAKAARRSRSKKDTRQRRSGDLSGNGQLYGPKKKTAERYARALNLYKEGRMTIEEVVKETGVPLGGFRHYIDQWHRDIRRNRKENKYGEAIASLRANPRPVSEVGREYGLNPDIFREYLKVHAPDLAEGQGMVRLENGRRVKRSAWEKYRPAIEEYRKDGGALHAIACRHGLNYKSLSSFLRRVGNL